MEMTQSMSNMLDLLLVDNLSISTRVERRSISERPLIIVVTENKSRFSLPGLTGILRIGRDDNEAKTFEAVQDSRAFLVSGTTTTTLKNKKAIKNEAPTLYTNTSQPLESHVEPATLMPGTKWVHILELDLEVLDEWLIEIDVTFKSPGTGKPLSKKHECCIYLLDQCSVCWLPTFSDPPKEPVWYHATMSTANLRRALQVPAAASIAEDSRFDLIPTQVQDVVVHGRVDTITEDGSEATCSLWCDLPNLDDDSQDESALTIELLQIVAGRLAAEFFQSFLDRFPAPLHPDLFNEPTGYEKALQEVKQYEDFTTIDWVQDAVRERYRQTVKSSEANRSWKTYLLESYEAGQAWLVVSLVGIVIGVNAAFIAICTEWLSDFKLGHCSYAWWLNQKFCCWGVESEDGACDEWTPWSSFGIINYVFYLFFATAFAASAAFLVKRYARYAAGSGISEIKCILAGFIMKGYLGGWTLVIKSLGLAMTVAANLSVGKEGPSIHIACCAGHVVSRLFPKYQRSRAKSREIISASAAAGVAVAFGAPIGGVLFSFEGLYGALIIKYNLKVQHVRKKYLADYGVIEAATLAFFTCTFAYWNIFMKIDMAESMNILFRECEGSEDYMGLCKPENTWKMVVLLFFAMIMRIATCTISYGAKVPAGIFVPSMAIGALFGRMLGLIVRAAQVAYPGFVLFSSCKPDVPCITPGTYAFLGAAAALGGVMRLTVCVVVIMFELTGALNYILPTMITLMVTKTVGDYFGRGGIADRYIRLNGYPFLDKEEHSFGIAVSQVMQKDVTVLPASGTRLDRVERLLADTNFQGFPVVEDSSSRTLIGYIGRSELRYVIDKAKRARAVSPLAHCFFRPGNSESRQHMESSSMGAMGLEAAARRASGDVGSSSGISRNENETNYVDFGPFIDQTPIAVHPKLPLETVMEFFKKMGPRVILIEHQGKLVGLITIKDLLKYITRTEALDEEEEEVEVPPGAFERRGDTSSLWPSGNSFGSRFHSQQQPNGSGPGQSPPGNRHSKMSPSQGVAYSNGNTRIGRSPSMGGMTMASSVGSFRERIELAEQQQGDVLFDHDGFDDDDVDDQDEGEVTFGDRRR
ncbi:glycerol ethanol, ferric requiring protein [Podila minutissima]|uniref:Chloride channel protein n=1 Tax=Podila minutissima TaxID=64525 RepID=A0A9P5SLA8_9FUNG|nr:glycerol ethanol, ferric requiring protein [Podila minutissima]